MNPANIAILLDDRFPNCGTRLLLHCCPAFTDHFECSWKCGRGSWKSEALELVPLAVNPACRKLARLVRHRRPMGRKPTCLAQLFPRAGRV